MSSVKQIAQALYIPYTEYNVSLHRLFSNQPREVIDEGLMIAAEWRDLVAIQAFHLMGANLHYVDKEGFSVLETVLQGHDGYWRLQVENVKAVIVYLDTHGVKRNEVTHEWIIEQCCDVFISKDKYLRDYLNPPKYQVWWHTPESSKLMSQGEFDKEPVAANKWKEIPYEQFIYIVKKDTEYKRYIITAGFGDATVIPLSETPKFQKKLSWLTTTLMGGLDGPCAPGEDDEYYDDEDDHEEDDDE